jgi:hypothetical protein
MRKNNYHEVLVFINFSNTHVHFTLNEEIKGMFLEIFSGAEKDLTPFRFAIEAWGYLVFEKKAMN